MKRIFILLAAVIFAQAMKGQGFSKAEYFFDTDPGINNGTPVTLSGTSDTTNFNTNISTALLSPGFHFLALRVKHNNGTWGLYETRGIYISTSTSDAAGITAAEYFFDNDPGSGNGIPLSVGTAGATVNFSAVIPQSLPTGFHFLAIRTRGTDGIWGLFETRGFYISNSTADAVSITAAEFFFDSDPGMGNGTPLSIGSSGGTVNFSAAIPTALPTGFHFLAIRTKGADGVWGLYEARGFYISTSTADVANITAAEYFFDNDPGIGNGTAASVGASAGTVNFTVNIPTALPAGFHFLSIRTKDADGVWGLYEARGFYISQATADMPILTAAEYFFDTDPGVGNGTSLAVNSPGNTFTQSFDVPVPSLIGDGQHFLAIRTKDQNRNWSLYDFDTLTVSGTIPVTGLFFSAKKEDKKARLEWYTMTELNTGRYEIERSSNGNNFEKIGQVTAAGNSSFRTDYAFTDAIPGTLNYYRLKQVDRDGKFIYSPTRLLKFDGRQFSLFPTITDRQLTINGIANNVQVRIFNSSKQLVRAYPTNASAYTMDVSALAAGTYWLIIEKNNELLFHQTFIKK